MSEIGYGIEVHKAVVHVEDAHTLGAGLSTQVCVLHGIEEPPKQLTADDIPETATRFWLTDALKTLWNAASTWVEDVGKKHVADKANPHETSLSNIKGYPETPTGKRYLNDLGVFDMPSVGGGGGGSPIYLSNVASDLPGYKKLSSVPDAVEVVKTITANNSTVYGETYLLDLPIDLSVVNAGQWVFDYWRAVSSAAQESYARIESFLRHADGTETTTHMVESPSIDDTDLTQRIITYTLQQFTALPTDRFGVRLSFRTTRSANTTYSYIVGGLRGHSIISPVPPRHDYLRDKDGNIDFLHLNNAQKNLGGLATGVPALPTVKDVAVKSELSMTYENIANESGESSIKVPSQKYVTAQIKDYTYIDKAGTITPGYYCRYSDGVVLPGDYKILSITASQGDILRIKGSTRSAQTALIVKFDANGNYIGYLYQGNGASSGNTYNAVDYVVESGVSKIVITSEQTEALITNPAALISNGYAPKFYTKTESDLRFESKNNASKYGIRFDIAGKSSVGERMFSSVGLSATIGVGLVPGYSDFDGIYPWSEMKRCNINSNANGSHITTFEGESGFSLTGSNGDVFVRIPKFYYDRYRIGNYEYITVSDKGTNVHPAFVETGKELDAIYVSAFEGGMYNGNYSSVANIIPKTNIIPSELLALSKARGNNYTLYDNRIVDMLFALISVEFGNRNTNRIFGYGIADYIQPATYDSYLLARNVSTSTNTVRINNGGNYYKGCFAIGNNITICDSQQTNILTQAKVVNITTTSDNLYIDITFNGSPIVITANTFLGNAAQDTNWCETINSNPITYHTGMANKTVYGSIKNTFNPMRYRWVENIVGNIWHYLPDVTFNGLQMYVCDDMSGYEMHKYTGPYKPFGDILTQQSSNGNKLDVVGNHWVDKLDFDINKKSLFFGKTINTQLLSTEGYGAYYYLNSGTNIIANGGGFDHLYRCNLLTKRAWIDPAARWFLYGGRLVFKAL